MDLINSEILRQFEAQGLTINEGIAVDARLVKSASRRISNDKIKQAREKYEQGDEKQALIYLQMSERLLHRAVDLGQDTDRGVQESIRNNLISLNL